MALVMAALITSGSTAVATAGASGAGGRDGCLDGAACAGLGEFHGEAELPAGDLRQ